VSLELPAVDRRLGYKIFPLMVVLLAVGLLCFVCWSIITPVFLAAVIAGTLHPLTVRVTRKFKGRKTAAAIAVTIAAMLAVVGPLAGFVTLAVSQGAKLGAALETANSNGRIGQAVDRLPASVQAPARDLLANVPTAAQVLRSGGSSLSGVLSVTGKLMLDTALGLIALFFLLLEGPGLIRWLEGILPVPAGQFRSLLGEFRRVSRSVLVAEGATAAIQALAGLLGLLIAGVPSPVFFTLATFFLALVPAIGAASCFVALGGVYLLDGHTGTGIFLLVWGVLIVGLVDNIVKPLFIKDGAAMHGAVVFFSLIGGLAAFGAAGLVAGPLVVAFFVAVMKVTAAPVIVPAAVTELKAG
jgi:predicted PurR-regulated permease PerM